MLIPRLIPTYILPVAWKFYYENIVRYYFTKGKNVAETRKEFTKKLNLKCFQKYKFRITYNDCIVKKCLFKQKRVQFFSKTTVSRHRNQEIDLTYCIIQKNNDDGKVIYYIYIYTRTYLPL